MSAAAVPASVDGANAVSDRPAAPSTASPCSDAGPSTGCSSVGRLYSDTDTSCSGRWVGGGLLAEDRQHALAEGEVEHGDDGGDDQDEDDDDGRVGDEFLAGRPDHLAELGDDLLVERADVADAAAARATAVALGPLGAAVIARRTAQGGAGAVAHGSSSRRSSGGRGAAGVTGVEPATSGFGDRRSGQLSYTPPGDGPDPADRCAGAPEQRRRAPRATSVRAHAVATNRSPFANPVDRRGWSLGRWA